MKRYYTRPPVVNGEEDVTAQVQDWLSRFPSGRSVPPPSVLSDNGKRLSRESGIDEQD